MQIAAATGLLNLVDDFTSARRSAAPALYKLLVFAIIEHRENEMMREYLCCNISALLREHASIPVGVLVGPLVKQMGLHGYCNSDFVRCI